MSADASPALLQECQSGVLRITLNRPERRNALSEGLLTELESVLLKAAEDSAVRCVVLAAAGTVFSSGHDLREIPGRSEAEYHALFQRCARVMQIIRKLPQPVIARVQGLATAAGCQLVAACDLAVASSTAQFATPGVKIGLFCTTPMVPLVRNIPAKVAMEMLLTGLPISAQRAYEVGLVNRVVEPEALDAVIEEWTRPIVASSPYVLRLGKQAFYADRDYTEIEAYAQAVDLMTQNALDQDAQEGINAFLQKRPPQWSAR